MKKIIVILSILFLLPLFLAACNQCSVPAGSDTSAEGAAVWYYPDWMAEAKYNAPIRVLDTDSALGRYSLKDKTIGIRDIVQFHGHPCDGLVIAYVEIGEVLKRLFPDGVIDRTDLRVVSKNGPCWVDTAAMMTGARINFGTLSIDPAIGDGFIIQKISTGETYQVHLKDGIFPKEQAELEKEIRSLRAEGKPVTPAQIDQVEKMADDLSKKLLNTPPEELLDIEKMDDYEFKFQFASPGNRGDIINKDVGR
ncbi:MAG: formylmethanofuran dehydrogenase subunit E family protein [Planctomycetia bacterium]|jgi:formylmethanofuran dehydrogenase subunit E/predicted small secreted protein